MTIQFHIKSKKKPFFLWAFFPSENRATTHVSQNGHRNCSKAEKPRQSVVGQLDDVETFATATVNAALW